MGYRPKPWSQLALGAGMLIAAISVTLIRMANTMSPGKALGKLFVFVCIVVWVFTGVVLVIRGLNKM